MLGGDAPASAIPRVMLKKQGHPSTSIQTSSIHLVSLLQALHVLRPRVSNSLRFHVLRQTRS